MKIVHAADLHLDSPLRGLVDYDGAPTQEVRGATRGALAALVDLCIAEDAAFLMIAGDLYDGDFKDYSTALFFTEQIARLRDAGTQVVWLRGNHDAQNRITKHLRTAEHVHELSVDSPQSLRFEREGVAFHGQGYKERDVQENLARNYPAPLSDLLNVGLLHTALDGREGHAPYAPCTLAELKTHGYGYWALGHVHQREVLSQQPWVVFPGNLQGRHIRETGAKGCVVLTVNNHQVSQVQPVELDQVRWALCEVELSEAEHVDDVIEQANFALSRARGEAGGRVLASRVRLVGRTRAHGVVHAARQRIENELRAIAVDSGDIYLERLEVRTAGQLSAEALRERRDALGDLFRAFDHLTEDVESRMRLWDELVRPLSPIAAELLREESAGRDDILSEARQLLEGRLLMGGDDA